MYITRRIKILTGWKNKSKTCKAKWVHLHKAFAWISFSVVARWKHRWSSTNWEHHFQVFSLYLPPKVYHLHVKKRKEVVNIFSFKAVIFNSQSDGIMFVLVISMHSRDLIHNVLVLDSPLVLHLPIYYTITAKALWSTYSFKPLQTMIAHSIVQLSTHTLFTVLLCS